MSKIRYKSNRQNSKMNTESKSNQPERLPVIEVKEISWQKAHQFFARAQQGPETTKEIKLSGK